VLVFGQRGRLHEREPPLDLLVPRRGRELEVFDERYQDRFFIEGKRVRLR
jgi:hypothetical protein